MNEDDIKTMHVTVLARVLIQVHPPAGRLVTGWAEKLYERGVRVHPELSDNQGSEPHTFTTEELDAVQSQAWSTLQEMGDRFPEIAPLVSEIKSANTATERAQLLIKLRAKIDPELLAK